MHQCGFSEEISVSEIIFPLPWMMCLLHSSLFMLLSRHLACYLIFIPCISFNLLFYPPRLLSWIPLPHSPWGLLLSPSPTSSCVWEYLFPNQEPTEMQLVDMTETPTSISLPLLHGDLCCVDRYEWRSSCSWLRAKRIASHPQQFKYWSTALFSLSKLCIQLCGLTALTVTAVGVHVYVIVYICW